MVKKKRSIFEIYYDVLNQLILKGPELSKFKIIRDSGSMNSGLDKFCVAMQKYHLLDEFIMKVPLKKGRLSDKHRLRKMYRITPKGREYHELFSKIKEMLK